MKVVPYIGTWIETNPVSLSDTQATSYLIQVRGLKLETDKTLGANAMSYLIQVRGLKLDSDNSSVISLQVVPYIGTWIETVKDRQDNAGKESRTLYRYVD